MPSRLTLPATEFERRRNLLRNLPPYRKPGAFTPMGSPGVIETELNDYQVVDSPDNLIDNSPFSDILYPKNKFGPNGGYDKDITGLISNLQSKSNVGPYGPVPPFTTALQDYSTTFIGKAYIKNAYSPASGSYYYYEIADLIKKQLNKTYWEPMSFVPSSYSPYAVLLEEDPSGDNGLASQDSQLAQIGVKSAKDSFQQRVNQNVRTQTLGRLNILGGIKDPVQLALIVAGKRPLIAREFKITAGGGNILSQGQDIVERIVGFTLPISPIPGDYFERRDYNSSQSATRAFSNGKRGGLFGLRGNRPLNPSQLFLDYTGSGQREQLTNSLATNKYRPYYNTGGSGILSALGNAITGAFARDESEGNFYVGTAERDPSFITSPSGQIPIDQYGNQVLSPVYGPDLLAKDFEGEDNNFITPFARTSNFGETGDLSGGFSWVSGKWAANSGRRMTPKGDYGSESPDWNQISGSFIKSESDTKTFKPGSILDSTQRLIDSQPNDGGRFAHVGNAIQQTSKIFNDGYKQITKGSQVIKYSDGQTNVGIEYCRIFTKDTPYYTFNDLQKKEGNIRKFTYSILDSTFNLNIAPEKGGDSLITTGSINGITQGRVKKYMFSLENLAWRTGYRPGYRVSDLPACEQGPNGGRIMWFPPYDLSFNEDTRPSFNETTFLGRPEPIYTYKNTSRSGTLKWKIVVDHPSILDLIVNKVLANEGDREKVDSIVDSFFAGCKKYDLYELAKIYNTVPLTELQAWQELINNPQITNEQYLDAFNNINPDEGTGATTGGGDSIGTAQVTFDTYKYLGFYFDNDIPGTDPQDTTSTNFQTAYNAYTSITNKQTYNGYPQTSGTTSTFFTDIVEDNFTQILKFMGEMYNALKQNQVGQIVLQLQGSASAPQEVTYNKHLSSRRIDSVTQFLRTYPFDGTNTLGDYVGTKILIAPNAVGEQVTINTPKGKTGTFGSVNCTRDWPQGSPLRIYSTDAMACRAVLITDVTVLPAENNPSPSNPEPNVANVNKPQPIKPKPPIPQPTQDLYKGASKKLLRYLLNECDYFEVMKATDPFVYSSIKEKLKYFQPAFHSTTPEGLNSRLTFLQQCTRPGDTIPTIGPQGEKLYNDALNTSFGAPPVLVLRVGDFFNTKIIPTGINFDYEKTWDMNPEGIGFQPMLVNVTLQFNFVGGMGLKNPIDTLQNALTFNYYANTEMYDERAEATEDTSKLDKEIVEALQRKQPTVGLTNLDNQLKTDGGNTIGIQTITGTTASGNTGTLKYGTFMNNFVEQTQNYYNTTVNTFENVLTKYNYGVLSMLNSDLNDNNSYDTGTFEEPTQVVPLWGKPQKTQEFTNTAFNALLQDVEDQNLPIFSSSYFTNPSITDAQKRLFKKNYSDYVNTYKSTFLNDLTTDVNTLVEVQQTYVYNVDRLTFVTSGTKRDGKLDKQNIAIIYSITGTPETANGTTVDSLDYLKSNYNDIGLDNYNFKYTALSNAQLWVPDAYQVSTPGTFTPPTSFPGITTFGDYQKREYTMMTKALLFDRDNFITALTQGLDRVTLNAVQFYYSTGSDSLFNQWTKLNTLGLNLIVDYRASVTGLEYEKYTPSFGTTLERIAIFSEDPTAPDNIKNVLQNIYSSKNDTGEKNPYNFKRRFL